MKEEIVGQSQRQKQDYPTSGKSLAKHFKVIKFFIISYCKYFLKPMSA